MDASVLEGMYTKSEKEEDLRDHFAGLAMQAMIAKSPFYDVTKINQDEEEIDRVNNFTQKLAQGAYEYADAMIEERRK